MSSSLPSVDPQQPEPTQPLNPPPRHRFSTPVLVALISVVVIAILAGISALSIAVDDGPSRSVVTGPPTSNFRLVTYEVLGSASSVDTTERTPSGSRQQSNVAVPMTRESGGPVTYSMSPGAFAYISAQNNGDTGVVTCRILVDGMVLAEVSSSGAYVIATCDGRVP
jgi:Mycobacterium membrane protein